MKITIVLGAFLPVPPIMGGAVEKCWFALAQEFARAGHEVTLISRAVPQFPRRETVDGITHLRVAGFDTPRSLVWLKICDLIYSWRVKPVLPPADIVVTNTFWLPILLRDASRGKIYVHVARYPKGQLRFYGHVARLQSLTHAIAGAIAEEVPQLRDKISVVPNPAPVAVSSAAPLPFAQRQRIILYVGRLHPEKGVHLLLEAFAANRETLADWKLVLVGPSESKYGGGGAEYDERLRSLAAYAGHVELTGPIFDPRELEARFRASRLFVYPSLAERGETFGVAPLEAMAHGCAVLVSSLDCFRDFISEDETGFVFDHRTAEPAQSLGRKITALAANESLLARVADAGYRKSFEFSLGNVAAQFLQDFERILK